MVDMGAVESIASRWKSAGLLETGADCRRLAEKICDRMSQSGKISVLEYADVLAVVIRAAGVIRASPLGANSLPIEDELYAIGEDIIDDEGWRKSLKWSIRHGQTRTRGEVYVLANGFRYGKDPV